MIILSDYSEDKEMYYFQTIDMLFPLSFRLFVQRDGTFYSPYFERIFFDITSLENYLLDFMRG